MLELQVITDMEGTSWDIREMDIMSSQVIENQVM